jgi:hypothetical protein
MIHPVDLRELVIIPTLKHIDMYSPAAVNLLLGTAAVESDLGFRLRQVTNSGGYGIGRGIYSIEAATHESIWADYLKYREELKQKIYEIAFMMTPEELIVNLAYSTALARIKYYWSPRKLPPANDIEGLAEMWLDVYNAGGAGKKEVFLQKYEKYVSGFDLIEDN